MPSHFTQHKMICRIKGQGVSLTSASKQCEALVGLFDYGKLREVKIRNNSYSLNLVFSTVT